MIAIYGGTIHIGLVAVIFFFAAVIFLLFSGDRRIK